MLPVAFHGGFGLLTVYGTPKPAYRAFQLLHEAGDKRLSVESSNSTSNHGGGDQTCMDGGVLATVANRTMNLFVFNHLLSGLAGTNCTLTIDIDGLATVAASSVATRIDEHNANPKASFVSMGSPESPSEEQLHALERASELVWTPLAHTAGVSINAGTSISVEVPPHGLCVLRIPIMQRVL
jgi:xylan 1,4-beta-xylosidase